MVKNICWRRQWHPTPVLLPGKSHGWRSLVACSPWGCYKSDRTEQLHFHFSLSCIGEGNGNPFQCSCREPVGLPSMGSHRVRHDWSDLAAAAARIYVNYKNSLGMIWVHETHVMLTLNNIRQKKRGWGSKIQRMDWWLSEVAGWVKWWKWSKDTNFQL